MDTRVIQLTAPMKIIRPNQHPELFSPHSSQTLQAREIIFHRMAESMTQTRRVDREAFYCQNQFGHSGLTQAKPY